jgi:hypothetical protein
MLKSDAGRSLAAGYLPVPDTAKIASGGSMPPGSASHA